MAEQHAGVLSKGIQLSYKGSEQGASWTTLTNLQEIPDIGNNAPDKIDVTVLMDEAKKSMAGLQDSSQDLAFKFLFEDEQFATLAALESDESLEWKVELPDGQGTATFSGTPSVKLAGVGVNAALTYTLTITVESLISFA